MGRNFKYLWGQLPLAIRHEIRDRIADMKVASTYEGMIEDLYKGIAVLERHRRATEPVVIEPDWETPCIVCGMKPTVPTTRMCGPCTFGDADTEGGNW